MKNQDINNGKNSQNTLKSKSIQDIFKGESIQETLKSESVQDNLTLKNKSIQDRPKRTKKRKVAALGIMLLGIAVMLYAGAKLIETQQIYQKGNAAYEEINKLVKGTAVSQTEKPGVGGSEGNEGNEGDEGAVVLIPKFSIPSLQIDFDKLKAVNEDAVAWLYSPDTVIDYPVMKANDYSYYLSHLPDGTSNANGSLFIDYNNASDFSGDLTVIYGHHMNSGRMFGSLNGYKTQSYFNEHPYMYLYTDEGNYRIDLIYGCVIGAGQWRERAFMYAENLDALMAYAAYNTTFTSGVSYQGGDRVVALSTCSYEFDNARYVVIGILRSEY